jgi:hypothetical protein
VKGVLWSVVLSGYAIFGVLEYVHRNYSSLQQLDDLGRISKCLIVIPNHPIVEELSYIVLPPSINIYRLTFLLQL